MNTSLPSVCPECGTPLPSDAPSGLCPSCLLKTQPLCASSAAAAADAPAKAGAGLVPGKAFGRYRIVRVLGRGGMGEVYEAEQSDTGRRVALKVMQHELGSETDRKRFLREGRLAAAVNHPNVIYIYGSEEIAGRPAIAMELVREGTLKDLVRRRGPLPVAEAVDAVLQILEGLEAAHEAGVLHRDIKPANCFLGADGVVKVGDFGLSISTLARGDSLLTASGSLLGTPGFASPEQLRGDALDVRSDLYSVGVTLYFLLTGKLPFEAPDLVKMIATVLDRPPVSPAVHRAELPTGLVKVILRCLAKDPAARFGSHGELRRALLPFGSRAPRPAMLGLRVVAGVIDGVVASLPILVAEGMQDDLTIRSLAGMWGLPGVLLGLVLAGSPLVYFGWLEGRRGAGVGKLLCGLRVVGPGGAVPGIVRAMVRAGLFGLDVYAGLGVMVLGRSREELTRVLSEGGWTPADWLWLPWLLILFSTLRRKNGFAGVHELITGTRVVAAAEIERRLPLAAMAPSGSTSAESAAGMRLGPYEAGATVAAWTDGRLIEGYDAALRRQVWIHVRHPGSAPVPVRRRDLSRPTRLRWLSGGDGEEGCWDAYEAPAGRPWVDVVRERQPWTVVRFWLRDLAEEFHAGGRHESLPETFAADRVWLTARGQAMVLDFPCPGLVTSTGETPMRGEDFAGFLGWLSRMAMDSLEGAREETGRAVTPPPPVACGFLRQLRSGAFESVEMLLGNLESLVHRRAEVTVRQRVVASALLPVLVVVHAAVFFLVARFEGRNWDAAWHERHGDRPSFRQVVELGIGLADSGEDEGLKEHFERVVASRYADVVTNEAFWSDPRLGAMLPDGAHQWSTNALAQRGAAGSEELEMSTVVVDKLMAAAEAGEREALSIAAVLGGGFFIVFAALSVSWAGMAGGPLLLRLMGMALVDGRGEVLGRGRLVWRMTLGWLPGCVFAGVTIAVALVGVVIGDSGVIAWWLAGIGFAAGVCGLMAVAGMMKRPSQVWADRWAGTFVVPR